MKQVRLNIENGVGEFPDLEGGELVSVNYADKDGYYDCIAIPPEGYFIDGNRIEIHSPKEKYYSIWYYTFDELQLLETINKHLDFYKNIKFKNNETMYCYRVYNLPKIIKTIEDEIINNIKYEFEDAIEQERDNYYSEKLKE